MIGLKTLQKLTEVQKQAAAMLQLYIQERRPDLSGKVVISSLTQPEDYYTQGGEGREDLAKVTAEIEAAGGKKENFLLLDGQFAGDVAALLKKLEVPFVKIKSAVEPTHKLVAVNIAHPDFKKSVGGAIGTLMADKNAQSVQALHYYMQRMGGKFAFDSEFQIAVYEGALHEMGRLLESARARAAGAGLTLTATPATQCVSRTAAPN